MSDCCYLAQNYIPYLSFAKNLQYQIYSNMNHKRILVQESNLRLSHTTELADHMTTV